LTESSPTNRGGFSSLQDAPHSDKPPITVSNPTHFAPESTETQGGTFTGTGTSPSEVLTELPTEEANFRPATPQERFAAFFTDLLIVLPLVFGGVFALGKILKASPSALVSGLTAGGIYLLYYVLTEAFLASSPGKMLAGLRLRRIGGGAPSFLEVLVRNLFRIVDYPLFFIAAVGLMEGTKRTQRLGDLAAGTTVVRDVAFEARRLSPETTPLAGATRRALAWTIDLAFVVPFFYGLLLLAPMSRPVLSLVLINLSLPLTILWLTLCETLLQTTFGKVVFGMKVAQEDGRPASFASVLLRNAFKLLDANPLGYLCIFLSSRKQRPGDVAAGTLVFRDRRGLRGWIAVPLMVGLSLAAARYGLKNPDNFVKKNVHLTVGPYEVDPIPAAAKRLKLFHAGIIIEQLDLGISDQEPLADRVFAPGQGVYVLFRISGYAVQEDKAWIQADLQVRDAQGGLVLDRPNAINSSLTVAQRKSTKLIVRFSLNTAATPGPYRVSLSLRDMFSGKSTQETETFSVR
jgi:uncharacterized RDD family membrane protein YckC